MKKVPFPQANNIELIFSVLNDIGDTGLSKFDVSKKYKIDERQGSYYLDSLLYLGFVTKINTKYFLSDKGIKTRLSAKDEMKLTFISIILEHPFIGTLYKQCQTINSNEKTSFIASRIFNELNLSSSTSNRRASTIKAWFDWIDDTLSKEEQK